MKKISNRQIRSFIAGVLQEYRDEDLTGRSDWRSKTPEERTAIMNPTPLTSSENLVGKKFSLEEGGEPEFVVAAQNNQIKKCIIVRYSKASKSIRDIASRLSGGSVIFPSEKYQKDRTKNINDLNLVNDAISSEPGWESSDFLINRLEDELQNVNETEFALIDLVKENFKKPRLAATQSGQQAAATGFKCVMSPEEAIDTIFTPATSPEWEMAAACFYSYANSPKISILAALTGGAIGALAGGAGSVPGSLAAMTATDAILRLPVLFWSAANSRWRFFWANVLWLAVSFTGLKWESSLLKNRETASKILVAAQWIVETFAQIIPDYVNHKQAADKELGYLINNPEELENELQTSAQAIKTQLQRRYPQF